MGLLLYLLRLVLFFFYWILFFRNKLNDWFYRLLWWFNFWLYCLFHFLLDTFIWFYLLFRLIFLFTLFFRIRPSHVMTNRILSFYYSLVFVYWNSLRNFCSYLIFISRRNIFRNNIFRCIFVNTIYSWKWRLLLDYWFNFILKWFRFIFDLTFNVFLLEINFIDYLLNFGLYFMPINLFDLGLIYFCR